MKSFYFILLFAVACFASCTNNATVEPSGKDTPAAVVEKPVAPLPDLPPTVIYKNWEIGDPQHISLVMNVYQAWDSDNPTDMQNYFADSANYDLPDGTRLTTTKETVEASFRKWRNLFKETANTPFSIISLRNKDQNEDWVIAWTWNKWRGSNGVRDSMLYCDNWRIRDNRIEYLNSLQNRSSKPLARRLNERIP